MAFPPSEEVPVVDPCGPCCKPAVQAERLNFHYGKTQALFDVCMEIPAGQVTALIGIILLAGVVVNNGIVLVDFINQLRRNEGMGLHEAVVEAGVLDEDAIVRFLADELSMPVLPRIEPEKIPPELIRLVPIRFAKQHKVLPVGHVDGGILVAVADPLDSAALDDLRAILGPNASLPEESSRQRRMPPGDSPSWSIELNPRGRT